MDDLVKKWKSLIKNEKIIDNPDLSHSTSSLTRLKFSEKV